MSWSPGNNSALCAPGTCSPNTVAFLAFLTHYLGFSYDEKFTRPKIKNTDHFDFIIVGAGSSGCVVANRLSENQSWKILLLERGDEEPLIVGVPGLTTLLKNSNIDYGYKTEAEPDACASKSCTWSRGKGMGGSSIINSMLFARGNKWDYDNWAKLGNPGWSWNEVLPYFKKSENFMIPDLLQKYPHYHGTGGYQNVEAAEVYDENAMVMMEAWKELGLQEVDANSGDNLGTSRLQFNTFKGARQSSNAAFIRSVRDKRPNLIIRPNSMVTKIIIDPQTKQTLGVEFQNERTLAYEKVYAKKEVIVSAGSIDSPKILMLSGIGPTDNLEESGIPVIKNSSVGKNLQNHVGTTPFSIKVRNNTSKFSIDQLQNDLVYWLNSRGGLLTVSPFLDNIAHFQSSFEKEPNVPDIEVDAIKFVSDESIGSTRFMFPYYEGFMPSAIYLRPKSRGEVKLDPKNPLHNQPLIHPNYFSHPEDIKAVAEGTYLTKRIISTKAFKDNGFVVSKVASPLCDHLHDDTFPYYECLAKNYTVVMHHFVGTCKMGPTSDPESVVDPRLKVIGIKGLRVIDASIMPAVTRGNTHAPAIMIGEKGSNMIKEHWMV